VALRHRLQVLRKQFQKCRTQILDVS